MDTQHLTKEAQNLISGITPTVEKVLPTLLDMGVNVISAIFILILGWWVAKWSHNSITKLMEKTKHIDETLKPLIASLVRYAVLIFVTIAVLAKFGIQTASIITVLGAAGLAIGLSLQGTLANIAAGVMILFLRPMKVGEYIDAQGHAGTIIEIGLFTTIMKTFDGVFYSVPNAELWNKAIKNYSRNPTRRIDVPVGISYDNDVDSALKLLLNILETDERVLADPAPETVVSGLGDNSVDITMRCWVNRDDYWAMYFNMHRQAKLQLEANGFTIPYPQRDVYMYESTQKMANLEKELATQSKAKMIETPQWPLPKEDNDNKIEEPKKSKAKNK